MNGVQRMKAFQYKKEEDYGTTWLLRILHFPKIKRSVFQCEIDHAAICQFRITRLAARFLIGGDALLGVAFIVGNVSIDAAIWSK